jgi:glycolate oxidase iron-sulfur subunit
MAARERASGPGGLIDYSATLDCVHCGLCLPHCPTYQETGREASSPRGRIYLMRGVAEGRIPLDERFAAEMHDCLACRACESACPAGVRYGHLVETARAEVDRRGARGRIRRALERLVLRRVVGSPRALRLVSGALRLYQRSGLQRLLRRAGLLRAFPGLARADRMLPPLSQPHRPAVVYPAEGERRGRVAFFAGCVMPELLGAANEASVEALVQNGFEVWIPRGQACCGALQLHSGDPQAAARLRARNRSVFQTDGIDAIVTNSAGCGAALKDGKDPLARRVRDIAEFLVERGLRAPRARLALRVAYDDPCHLLHGQKIADAPRALLRAIPGLELIDLPGHRDCCGAAGIYNLTRPEMSDRLLARKVDALRSTGVDALATGNPGCILQIAAGARAAGLATEVLHPVELLARAYALEREPESAF